MSTVKLNAQHAYEEEVQQLKSKVTSLEIQLAKQKNQTKTITRYFDCLIAQLPLGIAIVSAPDFRFLHINQFLADLNDLPIAAHIGQPIDDISSQLCKLMLPALTNIHNTAQANKKRDIVLNMPSGETKHFCDIYCALSNNLILCIVIDQTEQKQMQLALIHSNEAVEQGTQVLKNTQHQLIQTAKLASIGQLTAGLAHELNQPMGRIFLTAELIHNMMQVAPAVNSSKIFNLLQRIMKDVNSAKALMNHLRVYSRQDLDSAMMATDIKPLIEELLILFTHQIKIQGIQFTLEFNHINRQLMIIASQIEQVINNLMSNAIDSLKFSVHRQLILTTDDHDGYTTITVKDSGCGISNESIAKIFEPFFTTKPAGEGTGLGLSISKGIIDNHHGRFNVHSEPNIGSYFVVSLPNETQI